MRYRYPLVALLTIALGGVFAYGVSHRPPRVVVNVFPPRPADRPTSTSTPASIRCHVTGPVNQPGVYTLPANAVVQDALQAAGGPTADADLENMNLAAAVRDHEQIVVPRRTLFSSPASDSGALDPTFRVVNINTADGQTLESLPGIGPVLARRIIEYREQHGPFTDVSELIKVKGIGETTLQELRPHVTVLP